MTNKTNAPQKAKGNDQEARIHQAAEMYLTRQLDDFEIDGDFDEKGRWYPAEWEMCNECGKVRLPTIKNPDTLMDHCLSLEHVCDLMRVDQMSVGKVIDQIQDGFFYKQGQMKRVYECLTIVDILFSNGLGTNEAERNRFDSGFAFVTVMEFIRLIHDPTSKPCIRVVEKALTLVRLLCLEPDNPQARHEFEHLKAAYDEYLVSLGLEPLNRND